MWVPWAVVRDPSAAKRAAESGKACGITVLTSVQWWNPDLKRGRLGTVATKPLISFDSSSTMVWASNPWRDGKGWHLDRIRYTLTFRLNITSDYITSGSRSLHSYAIYTRFVTPLRCPDRICCAAVTQDVHRTLSVYWMRKSKTFSLKRRDWILFKVLNDKYISGVLFWFLISKAPQHGRMGVGQNRKNASFAGRLFDLFERMWKITESVEEHNIANWSCLLFQPKPALK